MTFGFPELKWLQLTGEVGKSIDVNLKFSQDVTFQKSL